VHTAYGDPRSEIVCVFEAPTASNFVARRCRLTDDMKREGQIGRETVDGIEIPVPELR